MTRTQGISIGVVIALGVVAWLVLFGGQGSMPSPLPTTTPGIVGQPAEPSAREPVGQVPPERVSVVGYWECLPKKGSGPHTMECALGIAIDQSDGHYAINTALMSTYPVDFPTGAKVRVTGAVHPAEPNTSYDIDGVLWATSIEKL